jgi:crossover junction endodeoxyribonuclease RuvC
MLVIGIDPGISGAICFFENGQVSEIVEMPVMADGKKNKRQVNGPQIYNEISKRISGVPKKDIIVVIEQVSAMPGQGVTSMFNFGQTFGAIKGICASLGLPIFFVRPSRWKKHFDLINSQKDSSRTKAIEMYPSLSNELSRKKDVNKADAILIARYFFETNTSK